MNSIRVQLYSGQADPSFLPVEAIHGEDGDISFRQTLDPQGTTVFGGLPPGPYLIRCRLPNGALLTKTAVAASDTVVDVRLDAEAYSPRETSAWAYVMQSSRQSRMPDRARHMEQVTPQSESPSDVSFRNPGALERTGSRPPEWNTWRLNSITRADGCAILLSPAPSGETGDWHLASSELQRNRQISLQSTDQPSFLDHPADDVGIDAEGRRTFRRLQYAQPSAGAGAQEDDAPARLQRIRGHVGGPGDGRALS